MKVTFSARHFDASDKLQEFAKGELMRLKKYFEGTLYGEVILEESGSLKVVDMRLNALGKLLPARVEGTDFYKIIPKAVEKIEKQLKAAKSKTYRR